ncbi:hypothetical protein PINS_up019805 [Pythium insidiosum]|nr:hypothetical protein PINS_up019805 [Pythium insidiosum]
MEATAHALLDHQREIFELAQRLNLLLCSSRRIGKTHIAAMLMRDQVEDGKLVVAIAASQAERDALTKQLARLCSEPVWQDGHEQGQQNAAAAAQQLLKATRRERDEGENATVLAPLCRIAVLQPSLLCYLLRTQLLGMQDIRLLVVDGMDDVHTAVPSLFRLAFSRDASTTSTKIFATTSTPPSRLNLDPRRNELLAHVQVINISPVVVESATQILEGSRDPPFPTLLPEIFDPNNMGNSAAVYDDRKKQERVNKFIQDAEVIYRNLGFWCLIKFVELELQANLQACVVDDEDNLQPSNSTEMQVDSNAVEEPQETTEDGALSDTENISLMAFLATKRIEETKMTKIRPSIQVITWLGKLLQASRTRFSNASTLVYGT